MFYEYRLTVPKNTPASSPRRQNVTLVPGTIVGIAVQVPKGCVGLVHAQVWEASHQLWPSNPEASIAGDGVVVEWEESYDLDAEPYTLTLVAWNLDDSFAHTVTFRVNLIEQARAEEAGGGGLLQRMARVLGVR
jgi:hypothetical protein